MRHCVRKSDQFCRAEDENGVIEKTDNILGIGIGNMLIPEKSHALSSWKQLDLDHE